MGDEKIQVVVSRVREFSHDNHNSFVYIINNTHFIISAYEKKTFMYIIHPFFMEVSYNGNGGTPNHPNSDHFSIEIHDTSPQMMGDFSVHPIQT